MNGPEFDLLLAEAASQRIGQRWLGEVQTACTEVTRRYDPAVYAVAERAWSDGEIDELVQDVTVEQLLHQGQLAYILDVSRSIDDVRRLLRFRVRRELARRRRRTVVDRLLARLADLLDGDTYEPVRGSVPTRYRPVGSDVGIEAPSDESLRQAAAAVRLLPTSQATGERSSPVFRSEVLAQVASHCFRATGTSLSIDDFGQILREALTSWLPEFLELDEGQNWPAEQASAEFELEDIVNSLLGEISEEDQQILYAKLSGVSDSDLASQLGMSRPTTARRKSEAFDRLRELLASEAGDMEFAQTPQIAQVLYLRLSQAVDQ
ncbi:hypothetical protein [Candidatus Poriferisocius sp.]|uniref:hypothetical protein n=1 Tax=Candidatus Poriferisocius sp. TaxID=3101276 RepID=UPI003B0174AF